MMNDSSIIKWGIIGCGSIANAFAIGLEQIPDARLVAVASLSGKAKEFGHRYNVERYYNNYKDLVEDSSVDIVYVATTHNFHHQNMLLCLNNGKSVLSEKPFTINAKQAAEVINLSRKNGLFLMEGMWTRFIPIVARLRKLIHEERLLGEIKHFKGDFCFKMPYSNEHRVFNPKLAGGCLLDLGIYPISFSSMVFREIPRKIMSSATLGETGVDIFSSYFFEYSNGATSMMTSSSRLNMPHVAFIVGSEGYIRIPLFSRPKKMDVFLNEKEKETIEIPYDSTGFQFEAMEAIKCIKDGKIESEIITLDESLEIMTILDTIRAQWNFKYPEEM
jgi:predicted dehydrogenase